MSTVSKLAIDAESKQGSIIAISVIFASLSALVVSLRLYTRLSILRTAGPDDWTILAALVRSHYLRSC